VRTQLVDNLGQAVRTQLVGKLATRCEIFACVPEVTHDIIFIPDTNFKIQLVPIPLSGRPSKSTYFEHLRDFYRSDHYNFWENSVSFPAVMVTDTSNFRAKMDKCYHKRCDSMRLIDRNDLEFLKRNTDAVIGAALELSEIGRCGMVRSGMAYHNGIARYGMVCSGMLWYGVAWYGSAFFKDSSVVGQKGPFSPCPPPRIVCNRRRCDPSTAGMSCPPPQ
jgi:hypothetical protein